MPFHLDDPELDRRSYSRTFRQEVDIALSAVDCVLNGEKAAYASSDLTTGRRFYDLLRETRARDGGDLRQALGEEGYRTRLFGPNSDAAIAFARRLRQQLGAGTLVVSPAPFSAPGWSQTEYLAFFEKMLRTRVNAAFFNDGWQFSSGCTFELAVAIDAGIPTFDSGLRPLELSRGIALIEGALRELEAAAVEPVGLRRHLALLRSLQGQRRPPCSPSV